MSGFDFMLKLPKIFDFLCHFMHLPILQIDGFCTGSLVLFSVSPENETEVNHPKSIR